MLVMLEGDFTISFIVMSLVSNYDQKKTYISSFLEQISIGIIVFRILTRQTWRSKCNWTEGKAIVQMLM